MAKLLRTVSAVGVVLALIALLAHPPSGSRTARAEREVPGNALVLVRFALEDRASTVWNGRVEVSAGRLEKIEGWHFPPPPAPAAADAPRSRITAADAWEAQSLATQAPNSQVDLSPTLPWPRAVWPQGIVLFLTSGAGTRVTVRFEKREPISFELDELASGPARFLEGAVEVERLPALARLGGQTGEADYPSLTASRDGTLWVAWQEYRGGAERVLVRSCKPDGSWTAPEAVSEPGDLYGAALGESGDSRLWVVWSAREGEAWHLWGRHGSGGRWSSPERLTSGDGPNLHHRIAADRAGRLWLVWQGFERGQSDIFLRISDRGWGPVVRVSESSANDWDPAVAVDGEGRCWIAWDTYAPGSGGAGPSYDVVARSMRNGKLEPIVSVAASARMEAHPSVAIDARGRPWIAYDEAGENWGKDWGFLLKDRGIGLYQSRTLRVVAVDGERIVAPAELLEDALPSDYRTYASLPTISSDGAGRIGVVFRYLAGARARTADVWGNGGGWENAVVFFDGATWGRPIPLARSLGRNDGRAAAVVAGRRLVTVYAADHRPFLGAVVADYAVYAAAVPFPSAEPRDMRLAPVAAPAAAQLAAHPRESGDVARVRQYRARIGGRELAIVRGDLHRHTDISGDGVGDGSLRDLYRYALDAAALDFVAVTDHGAGNDQEYSWWRTQKSSDLFFVPGAFTPLYGYERSLPYPNGHRNVVFDHRGRPDAAVERRRAAGEGRGGEALSLPAGQRRHRVLPHDRDRPGDRLARQRPGARAAGGDLPGFPELVRARRRAQERPGRPSLPLEERVPPPRLLLERPRQGVQARRAGELRSHLDASLVFLRLYDRPLAA